MSHTPGIRASAKDVSIRDFKPFWSYVVGAGRASEGLRADWQRQLKQASLACGFRYVRFHGLYHDDMNVYHETEGVVTYNFQYIDTLFDALLEMNVRPFVELGLCPALLATNKEDVVFWWKGVVSLPKNFGKWRDLISASVKHWLERYGLEEVATWYFETWNEPNLWSFWTGTRSQYYELYEVTVTAIKEINNVLRVGGPATSNFVPDSRFDGDVEDTKVQKELADVADINSLAWKPVWIEDFLIWCNERNLPVDFISCHPYPTDWALDSNGSQSRRVRNLEATPNDLALVRKIVSKSSYPCAEIHLTEWSSSPSSRDHSHDYVPAAIYVARTMLASIGHVDTLAYWTFSDIFEEEGAGPTPFHGGFGLINYQGYPKPTFHAFRLLKWLGNEVLTLDIEHGVVTRDSTSGILSAMIYHYPPEMRTSPPPSYEDRTIAEQSLKIGKPTKKCVVIEDLDPGAAFRFQMLSPGHRGDVIAAWKKLGSPATINRDIAEQLDSYTSTLNLRILKADEQGKLVFEDVLEPWTLIAIQQIKI